MTIHMSGRPKTRTEGKVKRGGRIGTAAGAAGGAIEGGMSGGASSKRLHNNSDETVMSWETRGHNRYYYRRRKVGGRVIADYVGAGYVAELLAQADELDRQRRQVEAVEWRATVEDDRRQDKALAQVDELVKSAVAAVLIVNGYHSHKRQWRRTAR